jgi:hypothetical protein
VESVYPPSDRTAGETITDLCGGPFLIKIRHFPGKLFFRIRLFIHLSQKGSFMADATDQDTYLDTKKHHFFKEIDKLADQTAAGDAR